MDLQIDDVPKDRVTKVDLKSPDRELQLAQKKPEPEKPADKETSQVRREKVGGQAGSAAATPEAKPEWELVEPKVNYPTQARGG